MPDSREDSVLLADHAAGDPTAFPELFGRHRNRLWAVALRTVGKPEDAEEALQEALLSVHRNAGKFRGESAVTTWMHRIVVNACLDHLRRTAARPTVTTSGGEGEADLDFPDPLDLAGISELRLDLSRALAVLPEDQRLCVVLVDVEGWPVGDVAARLGIPTGTVKSRCSRGRARLATELRRDQEIDPEGNRRAARGVVTTGTGPDASPRGMEPRTTDSTEAQA